MNNINNEKIIKIDLELNHKQASDLAQLIKRISFLDVFNCAVDEDEAYGMISALSKVQDALARHGYNPR